MSKRITTIFGAAVVALAFAGCEGPMGPEGAAGPAGPAGPQGPPGEDATASCTQCHVNDSDMFAREIQYQNSVHYTGGNFERNTGGETAVADNCAACHTSQGFKERIETGNVAADIVNPAPPNCRTCHQIHTTYTDADWSFTTTDPVELMSGDGTVDLGDVGNLCGSCHQARPVDPMPAEGTDKVLLELRYGYHHGPQANVLTASGGVALSGSQTIPTVAMAHGSGTTNTDGCATCHMADPFGSQAGGHTWNLTYEYHGSTQYLTTGCETCHAGYAESDFDHNGVQTTVQTRLDSLWNLLVAAGVGVAGDRPHAVADSFEGTLASAFLNFQMVEEDRSMGVHNPPFVAKLLQNSIEAVNTYLP